MLSYMSLILIIFLWMYAIDACVICDLSVVCMHVGSVIYEWYNMLHVGFT